MAKHVGIVACSAEGAALCYRTFCGEAAARMGPHDHPQVSLHGHSLADYVEPLERGDWAGVAALMLSSAGKLARAGAEVLICPDNTIHQAMPWVREASPLPWLHIAEVVAAEAKTRGFAKVGITGTKWLTAGPVYPAAFEAAGLAWLKPADADREEINRIIMDELVLGVIREESLAVLQRVIGGFREAGCDAVVLGCTEIPLIVNDANSPLPTLDSTRLLARAALDYAVRG